MLTRRSRAMRRRVSRMTQQPATANDRTVPAVLLVSAAGVVSLTITDEAVRCYTIVFHMLDLDGSGAVEASVKCKGTFADLQKQCLSEMTVSSPAPPRRPYSLVRFVCRCWWVALEEPAGARGVQGERHWIAGALHA